MDDNTIISFVGGALTAGLRSPLPQSTPSPGFGTVAPSTLDWHGDRAASYSPCSCDFAALSRVEADSSVCVRVFCFVSSYRAQITAGAFLLAAAHIRLLIA